MDISDAPSAAVTKSRREKDGLDSGASVVSSIACSLIARIEKQNGRRTRAAKSAARMDALVPKARSVRSNHCPAAIDRAFGVIYRNGRARASSRELPIFNPMIFK
ncbi:MAG TPA: hypothetical protein VF854_06540 [Azonexus sp.]